MSATALSGLDQMTRVSGSLTVEVAKYSSTNYSIFDSGTHSIKLIYSWKSIKTFLKLSYSTSLKIIDGCQWAAAHNNAILSFTVSALVKDPSVVSTFLVQSSHLVCTNIKKKTPVSNPIRLSGPSITLYRDVTKWHMVVSSCNHCIPSPYFSKPLTEDRSMWRHIGGLNYSI